MEMVKKNITMHTDPKLVRSEMNEYYDSTVSFKTDMLKF